MLEESGLYYIYIKDNVLMLLPTPFLIANTIKKEAKKWNITYYINCCLENYEKAGYIHIKSAFESLKTIGISDVTDVEFWDACIRMGESGSAETIEIQEDFKDFT